MQHVDEGDEEAGEDAAGSEFVAEESIRHDADGGGELGDVILGEGGDVHLAGCEMEVGA